MLELEHAIFPEYKEFSWGGIFFIFHAWDKDCTR